MEQFVWNFSRMKILSITCLLLLMASLPIISEGKATLKDNENVDKELESHLVSMSRSSIDEDDRKKFIDKMFCRVSFQWNFGPHEDWFLSQIHDFMEDYERLKQLKKVLKLFNIPLQRRPGPMSIFLSFLWTLKIFVFKGDALPSRETYGRISWRNSPSVWFSEAINVT